MRCYTSLAIALMAILIGGCANATVLPMPAELPPSVVTTEMLTRYKLVDGSGMPLVPINGLVVGPVDGLIVGAQSGETLYALILLEDIYNFGKGASHEPQNKYLLIPWSHLHILGDRCVSVDVGADVLAEAPTLRQPPDTSVPDWDVGIRRFWADK